MDSFEKNEIPSREAFLYMLHIALVEIRASSKLEVSHRLADIFHNLPMQLSNDWSPDKSRKVLDTILSKSKKYGMDDYIEKLIEKSKLAAIKK